MTIFVKVYQYTKWDPVSGTNKIRGWATAEAINAFEAIQIPDPFKEVDQAKLDENGKLREN